MSSLVCSGAGGELLKTNGQAFDVGSVEKSALTASQVVLCSVQNESQQVVDRSGQRSMLSVKPYGSYGASDLVLVVAGGGAGLYEALGADRQPVQLVGVLVSALVP